MNRHADLMKQGFMKPRKRTVTRKTRDEKLADLQTKSPYPVYLANNGRFEIQMPQGHSTFHSYTEAKKLINYINKQGSPA